MEDRKADAARRLDQFVDAAFAFSVTLLVITGAAPADLDSLVAALARAPAFAASFALIALFWLAQRDYARLVVGRSGWSTALSLAIVFTVLIYVYPLRLLSESAMHALSGGRLPGRELLDSFDDLSMLYLVYASGFAVLSLLMVLLYATVSATNAVSAAAREDARQWRRNFLILAVAGVASGVLAVAVPMNRFPWLPGTIYALIPIAIGVGYAVAGKRAAPADAAND